jgi:hypothetical protein
MLHFFVSISHNHKPEVFAYPRRRIVLTIRIPAFTADPGVVSALRTASAQTGTPFETLLASAALESGLQPSAKAKTSSASGMFQFTEQTWLGAVRQWGAAHGLAAEAASVVQQGGQSTVADPSAKQRILALRNDPAIASALAGENMRALSSQIGAGIGHTPDAAELYLGHVLGGAGATQMLQSAQSTPTRAAAAVQPAAARANQALFYDKTGTPYTSAQFVANMRTRVANAFAGIGAAMPQGPVLIAGTTQAGREADPAGAGASGWGITTPTHRMTAVQQSITAMLDQVFTRADNATPRADARNGHKLPAVVLSALTQS